MERFYCTIKKGQVIVKSNTTIIDTDERVKNFFEPTPDGHRKVYDADGLPSNELIPVPTDNDIFQIAKDEKIIAIDLETKASIILVAGSLENQSNLQAKSTQLTLKEVRGTITVDESTQLSGLEDLYVTVENMVNEGNARETQVSDLVLTDFTSIDLALAAIEGI